MRPKAEKTGAVVNQAWKCLKKAQKIEAVLKQ